MSQPALTVCGMPLPELLAKVPDVRPSHKGRRECLAWWTVAGAALFLRLKTSRKRQSSTFEIAPPHTAYVYYDTHTHTPTATGLTAASWPLLAAAAKAVAATAAVATTHAAREGEEEV
jgi:hypothetical protein